jgi:hypothetical protein
MKALFMLIILQFSASAIAANLYYSNGPAKGKDVAKVRTYIGYNDICFVGSISTARSALYSILNDDYEKESVFTSLDKTKDRVIYGYVDSKCTDEGESESDCRSVKTAKRCL